MFVQQEQGKRERERKRKERVANAVHSNLAQISFIKERK